MGRVELAFNSFRALGNAFGITDNPQNASIYEYEGFRQAPTLKKLELAERAKVESLPDYALLRRTAVREALEMESMVRDDTGIRILVFLPDSFTSPGEISEFNTYAIHVAFPVDTLMRSIQASRYQVGDTYMESARDTSFKDLLGRVDSMVLSQAEIYPELLNDRLSRLVSETKIIDGEVKKDKRSTPETDFYRAKPLVLERAPMSNEQLNDFKHERIIDYVTAADSLRQQYPHLSRMYQFLQGDSVHHMRFGMLLPQAVNLRKRMTVDPLTTPKLIDGGYEVSTNINIVMLMKQRDEFVDGHQTPSRQTSFELCQRLGI